mgnify:CR=1 FL=1
MMKPARTALSVRRRCSRGQSLTMAGRGRLETLESRVLLSAAPIGHIDILNRTTIAGWAFSPGEGPTATTVAVTINGVRTTVTAGNYRADLASLGSPYHAFTFTMPALLPGVSTVLIQALDPLTGATTTLANTTLTNAPPVAHMDVTTSTRLAGWAYDSDATGTPLQVRIDVDGVTGTAFTTDHARADVGNAFHLGTNMVGFDVSGNFAGKVVEVYVLDNPSNIGRLVYTNNRPPKGHVDVNNGYTVAGWAFDPDDTTAHVNIRVLVDGVKLSETDTAAATSRSDLTSVAGSPDHGYSITIPGLTPGKHLIAVYAIDAEAKSAPAVLLGYNTVTNAAPTGHVDVVNSTLVQGWALDPDFGAGPAQVSVYVDDLLYTTVTANASRPDLVRYYGSAGHGFAVNLTDLGLSSHSITVTVHDNRTSNQNEIVIYDDFINNRQPQGSFDVVKNGQLMGWAWDPDAPGTAIAVDVYVDGVYSKTASANVERPDLSAVTGGSTAHGFSIEMPVLSFGTHKIDLYGAEAQGNVSTLIGSKLVTNARPIGNVDVVNATTVKGWAFDADRPDAALDIKVYVNGQLAASGIAGDTRNDLVGVTGGPNYGFTVTLPTLSSGRNQVDVYAVDKNSGLLIALGSKAITV